MPLDERQVGMAVMDWGACSTCQYDNAGCQYRQGNPLFTVDDDEHVICESYKVDETEREHE